MNKYHNDDQRASSDSVDEGQLDKNNIRQSERGESTLNYVLAGVIGAAVAVVLIVAGGGAVYMMTGEKGLTTSTGSAQQEGDASTNNGSNKQSAEASSPDNESDKPSKDARERDRIISWLNGDAKKILSIWEDRYETTLNVSRVALADPVSKLKSTRRKWQNLDHPASLDRFHQWKTRELNWIITGFETFMARRKIGEFDLEIGKYVGQAADKILIDTLKNKQIDPAKITIETKEPNEITTKKYVKAFKDVYSNTFMRRVMQLQGYDIQKRLDTIRKTNDVLGIKFDVDSTFGISDAREKVKKQIDQGTDASESNKVMTTDEVVQGYQNEAKPIITEFHRAKSSTAQESGQNTLTRLKNLRQKWNNLEVPSEFRKVHKWTDNQFFYAIKKANKNAEFRTEFAGSGFWDKRLNEYAVISNLMAQEYFDQAVEELDIDSSKVDYVSSHSQNDAGRALKMVPAFRVSFRKVKRKYQGRISADNPVMKLITKMINDAKAAEKVLIN